MTSLTTGRGGHQGLSNYARDTNGSLPLDELADRRSILGLAEATGAGRIEEDPLSGGLVTRAEFNPVRRHPEIAAYLAEGSALRPPPRPLGSPKLPAARPVDPSTQLALLARYAGTLLGPGSTATNTGRGIGSPRAPAVGADTGVALGLLLAGGTSEEVDAMPVFVSGETTPPSGSGRPLKSSKVVPASWDESGAAFYAQSGQTVLQIT